MLRGLCGSRLNSGKAAFFPAPVDASLRCGGGLVRGSSGGCKTFELLALPLELPHEFLAAYQPSDVVVVYDHADNVPVCADWCCQILDNAIKQPKVARQLPSEGRLI